MPLPVVLCLLVFSLPESPRWLLQRHRYEKAYKSLRSLRHTDLQTGRDLFRIHHLLKLEEKTSKGKRIKGLFTIPRCRHALFASLITMVFQQFCGVNILAYYSSTVFANTDSSSNREALLVPRSSPYCPRSEHLLILVPAVNGLWLIEFRLRCTSHLLDRYTGTS